MVDTIVGSGPVWGKVVPPDAHVTPAEALKLEEAGG
jgi:hypothetical protein